MVFKKSKYGFNTGNTLRSTAATRKGLGELYCTNFDREKVESRLREIWTEEWLENYEEISLLEGIQTYHDYLFDDRCVISLNKNKHWLLWETLNARLVELLNLQASHSKTHISVCVINNHGFWDQSSCSSSVPCTDWTFNDLNEHDIPTNTGLLHCLTSKLSTKGVQRKYNTRGLSRSKLNAEQNAYKETERVIPGTSDISYIVEDNENIIKAYVKPPPKGPLCIERKWVKKGKGIKVKNKYWYLGVTRDEMNANSWRVFGVGKKYPQKSFQPMIECISRTDRRWKAKNFDLKTKQKKFRRDERHRQIAGKQAERKAKKEGRLEDIGGPQPVSITTPTIGNSVNERATYSEVASRNLPSSNKGCEVLLENQNLQCVNEKNRSSSYMPGANNDQKLKAHALFSSDETPKTRNKKIGKSSKRVKLKRKGDGYHNSKEKFNMLEYLREAWGDNCTSVSDDNGESISLHEITSSVLNTQSDGQRVVLSDCHQHSIATKVNTSITNTKTQTEHPRIFPTEPLLHDGSRSQKLSTQDNCKIAQPNPQMKDRHGSAKHRKRRKKLHNTNQSWPILIKVKTSSVERASLQKNFKSVQFGDSSELPKLFTINISCDKNNSADDMNSVEKNTTRSDHFESSDTAALLLFELLSFGKSPRETNGCASTQQFLLARLHIKAFLNNEGVNLLCHSMAEKLRSNLLYPVCKVVEMFSDIFKKLPADQYQHRLATKLPVPKTSYKSVLSWMQEVLPWQYNVCSRQDAVSAVMNLSESPLISKRPLFPASLRPITPTSNRLCASCGAVSKKISIKSLVSASQSDMSSAMLSSHCIALGGCDHSLCEKCLVQQLERNYAEKSPSLTCPVVGCGKEIDDLVGLLGMPLAMYRCYHARRIDKKINSHPLWQLCPSAKCLNAVRINGTSVLETGIVIQCTCGDTWCFHCKAAAHWPATCDDAVIFNHLAEVAGDGLAVCVSPFLRYACPSCRQAVDDTSSGEDCQCVYTLCKRHTDLPGSPVQLLSKDQKMFSVTKKDPMFLPLLFFHSAMYHRHQRAAWDWQQTEVNITSLARRITSKHSARVLPDKPKGAVGCNKLTPHPPLAPRRPVMHRSRTSHHLRPCVGTEQLLLSLVHQFVYQSHFFLENVFILLMSRSLRDPRMDELAQSTLSLEAVTMQIKTMLDELQVKPTGHSLIKLKETQEAGRNLLLGTAKKTRNLTSREIERSVTLCHDENRVVMATRNLSM